MFNNLTIRNKLILQIILVLVAVAAMIVGGVLARNNNAKIQATIEAGNESSAERTAIRKALGEFTFGVQEWKNTLLRANNPDDLKKYGDAFQGHMTQTAADLKEARNLIAAANKSTAKIDAAIADFEKTNGFYQEGFKAINGADPETGKKVDAMVRGKDRPTTDAINAAFDEVAQRAVAELKETQRLATLNAREQLIANLITIGLGILAVLLGITIVRSILRNIGYITDTVEKLNAGDLDARSPLSSGDELGQMGGALNSLLDQRFAAAVAAQKENDQLNNSVVDIMSNVAQLAQRDLTVRVPVNEDVTGAVSDAINMMTSSTATALAKVNSISREVSDSSNRVTQRADSVQALAGESNAQALAASQELGATAQALQQIGEQAQAAGRDAERALAATADALNVVGATVTGITESRDQIRETEKRVKRLAERSQEISSAVNIIGQIAERTSVLALNASMQAVAAGDAGRGFAVVADEVKRLAENAREATQQIAGLVTAIQSDTSETLQAMNATITQVVDITRLADRAGSQMNDTRQATEALANSVRSISQTTQAQSESSQRLLERASGLIQASERTLEQIAQQREDTTALNASASALVNTVSEFRLPQTA